MTNDCYTLYGAQVSLYSGKVRSYLKYKGVNFQEVIATRKVYNTVILPQTGIRFIPVVRMPVTGEYIQDTAVIIDAIERRELSRPVLPTTAKQLLLTKLFELYADEWLVIPAMHYRWNKGQDGFLHSEFGQVVLPGWPGFLQRFVGAQLASRFKGFVPKLGITPKTIPAIEDWYENDFLLALDRHFSQYKYLLGDAASIGDFGLMGPLYAHLYRDPRSGEIMNRTAPHVVQWIQRMHTTPAEVGTWLPSDDIPNTLLPILKRMFIEFIPVLKSTVQVITEWKAAHPVGTAIPRVVGMHTFQIGDAHEERVVASFSQWKLQRVLDVYQGFDEKEKQIVDDWLADNVGPEAKDAMSIHIPEPLTRQNNKLVWASDSIRMSRL
jgi:glutathione S-transferase